MSYLLDTSVLRDTVAKQPNAGVEAWLLNTDPTLTYLSLVPMGELRRGVERLEESKRKQRLEEWLEQKILPEVGEQL